MKKIKFFALMSAIALTSAIGFSACSSSDEAVADVNPTFDGEAVKTQFTISFPQDVAKTRQTAGTVQATQAITDFRGIDNIVLLPFGATGAVKTDPIGSSSKKLGDAIDLKSMIKPTTNNTINNSIPASIAASGDDPEVPGLTSSSNSVLFDDVTIPVGTGSFLFYGKAIDDKTNTDYFYNGKLKMSGTEPEDIVFDLQQIYTSSTTVSAVGAALATYLSDIARAEHWADCADTDNSNEAYYNAALGQLYTDFITLKAGSSLTVQAAVQDLYHSIYKNTDVVSVAIKKAILSWNSINEAYDYTYASDDATNPTGTLTFTAAVGNSPTTYFPGDVNLPDGAAMLSYTASTKTFAQVTDGSGNTGRSAAYADYVFPASLYYYSNSGIGTSTTKQVDKYNGSNDWSTILGNYDGTSIVPATRSVAILDPIQYAVGRLDMTVKTEAATLYDKKGEEYNASGGFTVTGVLIGGQKQVQYNFTTVNTATPYTIYDNITKSQPSPTFPTLTATTTASGINYTLALETLANTDVYIAVELVNNGEDFEGADGVVPKDCKFYLVAKLTPSAGTGYDADKLNQVFKQDYKTIANFTIPAGDPNTATGFTENTTGLGKAYNTIPDLRTPEMELGLSVDLKWQSGLQFGVNLGTE